MAAKLTVYQRLGRIEDYIHGKPGTTKAQALSHVNKLYDDFDIILGKFVARRICVPRSSPKF